MPRRFDAIAAFIITFGSLAATSLLTRLLGDICWPPRVGALLIGGAVFIQGFIAADATRFARVLADGTTLQQRILQISFLAAIFGTLFAAFGDMLSPLYGVPLCGKGAP